MKLRTAVLTLGLLAAASTVQAQSWSSAGASASSSGNSGASSAYAFASSSYGESHVYAEAFGDAEAYAIVIDDTGVYEDDASSGWDIFDFFSAWFNFG